MLFSTALCTIQSDVFGSLHKILPRFDKLMEGYRSENGKSETFLEVRDFDRRPESRSLMRIELRIRAADRKLESQIDSRVASSGTNFASSSGRHFPHDTLGWVGLRLSVAWRGTQFSVLFDLRGLEKFKFCLKNHSTLKYI